MDSSCMILYTESTKGQIAVYYASAKLSGDRSEVKNTLARGLLRSADSRFPVEKNVQLIKNDIYGCPRLHRDYQQSIAISFSYTGQEVWAAVAKVDALGIDIETPGNFSAPYPYGRVFLEEDFHNISSFCKNKEDAAAMLWSCKEAAVKYKGTGFHFIDPRDVRIHSCMQDGPFSYRVSVMIPEKIHVVVMREQHHWLALAVSG